MGKGVSASLESGKWPDHYHVRRERWVGGRGGRLNNQFIDQLVRKSADAFVLVKKSAEAD